MASKTSGIIKYGVSWEENTNFMDEQIGYIHAGVNTTLVIKRSKST
jgi:hypothetical protein